MEYIIGGCILLALVFVGFATLTLVELPKPKDKPLDDDQ